MKKINFEKIFADYEKLPETMKTHYYGFDDYADLLSDLENDNKNKERYADKRYMIAVHPCVLIHSGFKLGYIAALRKMKALEKKERKERKDYP